MKTLKSLFLLCAGLSFCACSSDNEPQFPEGKGRVEVRIVSPKIETRGVIDALTTSTTVSGTYSVRLKDNGTFTDWITQKTGDKYVFENVTNPQLVEAKINEGASAYNETPTMSSLNPLVDGKSLASSVPAFGSTTKFSPSSDGGVVTYAATVKMAIPVARLELDIINFTNSTEPAFTQLTVAGVYMDNLRTTGGEYVEVVGEGKSYFKAVETPTLQDFYFKSGENSYGVDNPAGTEKSYDQNGLGDVATDIDMLDGLSVKYAYNFFGATPGTNEKDGGITEQDKAANPQFKICFSATTFDNETTPMSRYAMITNYKKKTSEDPVTYEDIVLENGKIYKITGLTLNADNIVDAEDADEELAYKVEVTVQEAVWELEEIYADWAQ